MNRKYNIVFVGLSKNCYDTLKKNLNFLLSFEKNYDLHSTIIVIDSDSIDGTKQFCKELENKFDNFLFVEKDFSDETSLNRIEKLTLCRNIGINKINNELETIYIPMDMDIDLFKFVNNKEFFELINNFENNDDLSAIFPFTIPFYYDIFALRSKGWVENNSTLIAHNFKKRIRLGSFFFNYYYVFSKMKPINNFSVELINVESAFGGIGMYKLKPKLNYKYTVDEYESNFVSEHISFNSQFDKLYILKKWNTPSPEEYIFYKNYNYLNKFKYILKTIKYDVLSIFKK